jgi:hydroxymethylpyrimidine/phosphomethylpyrimidine kinase
MTPRILVIAGSDSGGGAGIQADIKTITMLGGHAMTAITAITAQNTLGVSAVHAVPTEMVIDQIDAVLSDIGADAVKIGMIGSAATAEAVATRIEEIDVPIVFDPVMVATSGSVLADEETIWAFERLMRLSTLVTPNAPELRALIGGDGEDATRQLAERTGTAVLAKGGDLPGQTVTDLLIREGRMSRWEDARILTEHHHGTGCTLASAIAAELGRGVAMEEAVQRARSYVRAALQAAPGFGGGNGPMGHTLGAIPLDAILKRTS